MIAAAQKASRNMVRDFGEVENLQVSRKGPADFVSTADRRAEQTIRAELLKARPKYGFILEEGGVIEGSDTSNRWIVDPLDGTTNFLHGVPHFAISIALERDNDVFAGVVYDPVKDELFWAEKGAGAHLNNRRLRVSSREGLDEGLFATGIPFKGTPAHDVFHRQLAAVMMVAAGVRRQGAASLDLAYVAAGRYDGYWENRINYWDVAAGTVIVREAGGFVSTLDGERGFVPGRGVVATNDRLRTSFLDLLTRAQAAA